MQHLGRSAAVLCIIALAACDSTSVDPGTTGTGPAGGITVNAPVLGAVPVLDDVSGHLYDAVPVDGGGINWADAHAAALAMTVGSCQADLASITSEDENAFILTEFDGGVPLVGGPGYWIGGFQPPETTPPDADWMWVSGDALVFADWADGQPDDGSGVLEEDAIRFVGSVGGFGPTVKWDDVESTQLSPGYIVEFDGDCSEDELVDVMLRLTQGEGPRNINLKSQGKIAVAVLSMADSGVGDGFDAATIDPATVTLGDGADPDAPIADNKHGKLMVAWPDLNEDGLKDALFHFRTQDLVEAGLTEETTELVIHGMAEGIEFSGTDEVAVK